MCFSDTRFIGKVGTLKDLEAQDMSLVKWVMNGVIEAKRSINERGLQDGID
jgi:hypothetical protein